MEKRGGRSPAPYVLAYPQIYTYGCIYLTLPPSLVTKCLGINLRANGSITSPAPPLFFPIAFNGGVAVVCIYVCIYIGPPSVSTLCGGRFPYFVYDICMQEKALCIGQLCMYVCMHESLDRSRRRRRGNLANTNILFCLA